MKIRTDFVTNSSSSSFIITNTSTKRKTLKDLFVENPWIYEDDNSSYYKEYSFDDVLADAEKHNIIFNPGETKEIECGDHSDDGLDEMYIHNNLSYHPGHSKSFKWKFGESHH